MMGLRRCLLAFSRRKQRLATFLATLQVAALVVLVRLYVFQSDSHIFDTENESRPLTDSDWKEHANGKWARDNHTFNALQSITLKDAVYSDYFQDVGSAKSCFVQGTDVKATLENAKNRCVCRENYFGRECGVPAAAWYRYIQNEYHKMDLKPRQIPRRVIHGLNINHEIDLFEVRLEELQETVDAYIVCESNYTAHGDSKPYHLLAELNKGYVKKHHSKIIHVELTSFPEEGKKDGWYIDMYLRTYMGLQGLRRIKGIRDDDLFLLLDADEIPTKEVILFLKLYDSYPEPVRLAMRWSVFGFFWKRKKIDADTILSWLFSRKAQQEEEELVEVTAVGTMAMVREVCLNNTFLIRKDMSLFPKFQKRLKKYAERGHKVDTWTVGTKEHYAGYHCSWCYKPQGIRTKLLSAHVDDKPRWGDYPEKTDLQYIKGLIEKGEWFDESKPFLAADDNEEKQYAPRFIKEHPDRFQHILFHPNKTDKGYNSRINRRS